MKFFLAFCLLAMGSPTFAVLSDLIKEERTTTVHCELQLRAEDLAAKKLDLKNQVYGRAFPVSYHFNVKPRAFFALGMSPERADDILLSLSEGQEGLRVDYWKFSPGSLAPSGQIPFKFGFDLAWPLVGLTDHELNLPHADLVKVILSETLDSFHYSSGAHGHANPDGSRIYVSRGRDIPGMDRSAELVSLQLGIDVPCELLDQYTDEQEFIYPVFTARGAYCRVPVLEFARAPRGRGTSL